MEIGELVICLCPVSLLQYSARVAKEQLKVVVDFIQHTRAWVVQYLNTHSRHYISEVKK